MESGFLGIIIVVRFTCRLGFGSSSMWHVLYDHVNVIDDSAGEDDTCSCKVVRSFSQKGLHHSLLKKHRLYKHWKFTMCPFWTWSLWDDKTAIDKAWQLTSCNVRKAHGQFIRNPGGEILRSFDTIKFQVCGTLDFQLSCQLEILTVEMISSFYIEVSVLRTRGSLFRSTIELYVEVIRLDVSVPRAPFMEMSVWIFHQQAPYSSGSLLIVSTWFLNAIIPFLISPAGMVKRPQLDQNQNQYLLNDGFNNRLISTQLS